MKIVSVVTDNEIKRRLGWFFVLMIWVGMVTAVVIHRSPVTDDHIAQVSSVDGYVDIREMEGNSSVDADYIDFSQEAIEASKTENKQPKQNFFIEYRMNRDQARSEQINLLREMINNPNSDKSIKVRAQERLLTITNNIEKEMEIESLIRARGYNDGLALIHDRSVELIIETEGLEREDVIKLGDIISNSTDVRLENITIIEKKPE
ncbi:SpoIIIAH-like family protein [Halonatronum saccharophilum]|uniref:SpoIIIAH-like family protein n=1 Tax=Halonatronum saccharophilum TaxID=150060 RepID=UPI000481D428|nr:SpoIIIAH-like family protein [Halonatronum saccharophilum]